MCAYVFDIDHAMCCHQSPALQHTNVFQIHLRAPLYLVACLVPGTDNILKCTMCAGIRPFKKPEQDKHVGMDDRWIDGRNHFSDAASVYRKKSKMCFSGSPDWSPFWVRGDYCVFISVREWEACSELKTFISPMAMLPHLLPRREKRM